MPSEKAATMIIFLADEKTLQKGILIIICSIYFVCVVYNMRYESLSLAY